MALTYTPAGELGSLLPKFELKSVHGETFSEQSFMSARALVILFICNHCPYVQAIEERLLNLAREMQPNGAQFVAICSNDPTEYEEDSPENLRARADEKDYPFPYLFDETQAMAKAFGAVCTPDIFLYDQEKKLAYRGRLDDSWKDAKKVERQELKLAIKNVLQNKKVDFEPVPSMGCSIKWKNGV